MSTWTDEKHEDARKALDEDMSQWGSEYGVAALDEIERLRAEVERLMPFEAHVSWLWGDTEPGKTSADMVERAARGIAAHWKDMHTNESLGRERALARAALESALNPKENEE